MNVSSRIKRIVATSLFVAGGALAVSTAPSLAATSHSSAARVVAQAPPPCGWVVAESAYNRDPGSNHNYGVTDLNYDACSRDVYGSLGSYYGACEAGIDGCGSATLARSDFTSRTCNLPDEGTGCNTAALSDAGYLSYVQSFIDNGPSDAQATTAKF